MPNPAKSLGSCPVKAAVCGIRLEATMKVAEFVSDSATRAWQSEQLGQELDFNATHSGWKGDK
jgi:hypothetical protein